jgi:phospholipid transport system transporter-binding protein
MNNPSGKDRLVLTGALTVEDAPAIRTQLLQLVSHLYPSVDLEGVESVDVAMIQLLYSAHITSGKMGRSLTFINPPAAVRDKVSELGLTFPGL